MKVTEAIEKGVGQIEHVTGIAFAEVETDEYCGCAIGLALVGKLGLDKVKTMYRRDEDLYDAFEDEFDVIPSNIWKVNDNACDYPTVEDVVEELKRQGY